MMCLCVKTQSLVGGAAFQSAACNIGTFHLECINIGDGRRIIFQKQKKCWILL